MNYNHLFYFWTVARHGSVAKASAALQVASPTITEQIRKLEASLGVKLFERAGRGLRLTDAGHRTLSYAEQIYRIGREMTDAVQGNNPPDSMRLAVGIVQSLSALTARRLIAPAMKNHKGLRLECTEGSADVLLVRLALHQVDVVISDAPSPAALSVRGFSHLLGRCGVSIVGTKNIPRKGRFPQCLDKTPFLMPEAGTSLHNSLQKWFAAKGVRPTFVGEFSGSALLEAFGEQGTGFFAVPSIMEREVKDKYKVGVVGRLNDITQEFYAITRGKLITHPAVVSISQCAAKIMRDR